MLPIDRWIMERVNETTIRAAQLLNEFEIGQARHEIDELFWNDFCDFYIEIAKERLYQPQKHGEENCRSGQTRCITVFLESLSCMRFTHRI